MALPLGHRRWYRPRAADGKSEFYFRFDLGVAVHIKCGMLDVTQRIRSEDVAALPAAERLAFLRRTIDGPIVFTHGFGIEGQLIFHWICERGLDIDVVTLDTGRLFPETYTLWAETERRYGRRIRAIYPNRAALERLVAKQGINGIYESKQARTACCDVRKTRPLDRALAGAAAWITGLRADQNETGATPAFGFDASRGLLKFNPLFDWTREARARRGAAHDVPINACTPRASPRSAARPARARSARRTRAQRSLVVGAERQHECGLHLPRMRAGVTGQRRCADPVRSAGDNQRQLGPPRGTSRLSYFGCIARQMRSDVAGISMCLTPNSDSASTTRIGHRRQRADTAGFAGALGAERIGLGRHRIGSRLRYRDRLCACGMA